MANLRPVGIVGMGSYVPPGILTNEDLAKIVETSDEWIVSRTGIKTRHQVSGDMATSDVATEGARRALDNAGMKPEEVQLIINSLVSPDMVMPSTACFIQEKLGAKNAGAFDLFAGCTGFVYSLSVATQLVATGAYDNVLVIGADVLTKLLDWKDRNTCVLFGDGGGAAVVKPVEEGYGFITHILGADGGGASFIEMPGGGTRHPATHETVDKGMHLIKMNGKEVFKFAVPIMETMIREVVKKAGFTLDDVDLIVPHQANNRILDSAAKRLNFPREKIYSNLERYGNTSAGTIPLALVDALNEGRIKKGDLIVLVGFGAGLTWGATILRWAY